MGKIYCMMGKSSTGKDTLYKMLLEDGALSLKKIIPYTTRPMRRGETDGVEYYFCGEKELSGLLEQGKVIDSGHTIRCREYGSILRWMTIRYRICGRIIC